MLRKLAYAILASTAFAASAQAATSINIDFGDYAPGTAIGSQIPGVTFSVFGGPGPSGTPVIDGYGNNGLSNSVSGAYPTGAILDVDFDGLASGVSFNFNNYGASGWGRGATFYSAFGALGNLLESGFVGGGGFFTLASSGIADLQFNNNTGGGDSWLFDLRTLQATVDASSVSPVPEPETYALMMAGGALILARRRKQKLSA